MAWQRIGPDETHVEMRFDEDTLQHQWDKSPLSDDKKVAAEDMHNGAAKPVGFDHPYVWRQLRLPPSAPVAPGPQGQRVVNTLKPHPLEFTYLDVGQWGDGLPAKRGEAGTRLRDFGLIWGQWAALCSFNTGGGGGPIPGDENPLNDVIAALRKGGSVNVVKHLWTKARHGLRPDEDTVYVILPDLHLPIATSTPNIPHHTVYTIRKDKEGFEYKIPHTVVDDPAKHPKMGRVGFESDDYDSMMTWYRRYLDGDIFGTAGPDLEKFLTTLAGYKHPTKSITVVQVGDMYDLWIGLKRRFELQWSQRVVLETDPDPTPQEFVDYWVKATDANFPGLMAGFRNHPHEKVWLWGNHDNYFAAYCPVPGRQRVVRTGGVYIEHGHRADGWNSDGSIKGHAMTNAVFYVSPIRNLDPDLRKQYIHAAAVSFVRGGDFCVYAMGHTHAAYLTRVVIDVDWAWV